jgi:hypothetical protein
MNPRDSVQRENFRTYMFALYLVAGLALSEVFFGLVFGFSGLR